MLQTLRASVARVRDKTPERVRRQLLIAARVCITAGAFYLLLTHQIDDGGGRKISIFSALREQLRIVDWRIAVPFVLLATSIKCVGILSSMLRWHLLLQGQGIRFNFGHIVGSFLIGRFLGTFLPSTLGLDGYKLYDASRYSGRLIECAAATAVEKVLGIAGIFLTFLVTMPFGYQILGDKAFATALITVPIALLVVVGVFALLLRPQWAAAAVRLLPHRGSGKVIRFVEKLTLASGAYRGRTMLLLAAFGLSFAVHFTTAAMYFFTALGVGAANADFGEVAFASSIQIFATVISPFTLAGEGVREIVQALLLAKRIGASASILSAALGFWAAEALTLVGAVFYWTRRADYRPRRVDITQ